MQAPLPLISNLNPNMNFRIDAGLIPLVVGLIIYASIGDNRALIAGLSGSLILGLAIGACTKRTAPEHPTEQRQLLPT